MPRVKKTDTIEKKPPAKRGRKPKTQKIIEEQNKKEEEIENVISEKEKFEEKINKVQEKLKQKSHRILNYKIKENYDDISYYVSGNTPILVRDPFTFMADIMLMKDLVKDKKWHSCFRNEGNENLEEAECIFYDIWCCNLWLPIDHIVRYKYKGEMLRVNTYNGCIDVPVGHKFIDGSNAEPVSVDDSYLGDPYLHLFPKKFGEFDSSFELDEMWLFGYFLSNGKCYYNNKNDYFWEVRGSIKDRIKRAQKELYKFEIETTKKTNIENKEEDLFEIFMEQDDETGMYYLRLEGDYSRLAFKYRNWFYDSEMNMKVPKFAMNVIMMKKLYFMLGAGMHDNTKEGELFYYTNSKMVVLGLYYILVTMRYDDLEVLLDGEKTETYVIRTQEHDTNYEVRKGNLRKILNLGETEEWLYMMETPKGSYSAGAGVIENKGVRARPDYFRNRGIDVIEQE